MNRNEGVACGQPRRLVGQGSDVYQRGCPRAEGQPLAGRVQRRTKNQRVPGLLRGRTVQSPALVGCLTDAVQILPVRSALPACHRK